MATARFKLNRKVATARGLVFLGGAPPNGRTLRLFDGSDYGRVGTRNGAIRWRLDPQRGYVIDCPSDNDYFNLGNQNWPTGPLAVMLWFNCASNADSVITKGASRGGAGDRDWDIHGDGAGNLRFVGTDGLVVIWNAAATHPGVNTWHHVVGQWDGTGAANRVQIYVDGVFGGQATAANVNLADTHNVCVGGSAAASLNTGQLTEVRIYDRMLSPAEIWHIYNCTRRKLFSDICKRSTVRAIHRHRAKSL